MLVNNPNECIKDADEWLKDDILQPTRVGARAVIKKLSKGIQNNTLKALERLFALCRKLFRKAVRGLIANTIELAPDYCASDYSDCP